MRFLLSLLMALSLASFTHAEEDYSTWGCGFDAAAHADAASRAQWPRNCMDLKLHIDPTKLKGISAAEFREQAKLSCKNCSAVSGLKIQLTDQPSEADIAMRGEAMRGSILAYAYFPSNRCGEQLAMRFNSNVNWSKGLFLDTLTHELGHNFGLDHTNDRRDIMYPSIVQGRALDGTYGPHYSIPQLVARYGEAQSPPPDEPDEDEEPGPVPPRDYPILTWLIGSGVLLLLVKVALDAYTAYTKTTPSLTDDALAALFQKALDAVTKRGQVTIRKPAVARRRARPARRAKSETPESTTSSSV